MAAASKNAQREHVIKKARMPAGSVFYDRLVPIALAVLGIMTVILIFYSIGVLTGLIRWS